MSWIGWSGSSAWTARAWPADERQRRNGRADHDRQIAPRLAGVLVDRRADGAPSGRPASRRRRSRRPASRRFFDSSGSIRGGRSDPVAPQQLRGGAADEHDLDVAASTSRPRTADGRRRQPGVTSAPRPLAGRAAAARRGHRRRSAARSRPATAGRRWPQPSTPGSARRRWSAVRRRPLRPPASVPRLGQRHLIVEDAPRVEAGIDAAQRPEAAHHHPGPRQQDDARAPPRTPSACVGCGCRRTVAPSALLERVVEVGPSGAQRRQGTGQDAGHRATRRTHRAGRGRRSRSRRPAAPDRPAEPTAIRWLKHRT